MNAETLARFCAVRELDYVEQGLAHGVRGAWFQTRKRVRQFFTDAEVIEFTEKVRTGSDRHKQVNGTFTS
jgi:hypothetical protein